ncbi:MAG TPA: hypothetical protein VI685_08370, partial [Candidatus Angelobacter sp.]
VVTVAKAAYDEAVAKQDLAAAGAHTAYLQGKFYALNTFGSLYGRNLTFRDQILGGTRRGVEGKSSG